MFISSLVGGFLIIKSMDYYALSLELFVSPLIDGIILLLAGILLFINNLRYLHKHPTSFHYLQTEVIPNIQISPKDHETALNRFEQYMAHANIINTISKSLIICTGLLAIFIIDLSVYIYNSNLLFIIDMILVFLFIFIILVVTNLMIAKCYKTYIIPELEHNAYVFVDFHFIYLYQDPASLPCLFTYKMNIATGLSRLGEYEYANIYLKQLWNEEKRLTKNKSYQLIYYFNCFIFAQRLHLDNVSQYKDKVNQLLNSSPRLNRSKSTQFIPQRIQIEEAFADERWNDVIQFIKESYHLDTQQRNQTYYDYMLYIAYLHTDEMKKAHEIYNKYENDKHFQKLIEWQNKTID